MTNEIIQIVAEAIGGLENDRCNPCTKKRIVKCENCLNAAICVILALRDNVTNDMIIIGNQTEGDASEIFNAMLNKALDYPGL